jgi:tetratricopeptide (TPR) repeat protein
MNLPFAGRERELAWLRSLFDECARKAPDGRFRGPRMACIIAESGIGKSRLVQELYLLLARDPRWNPPEADYWPTCLGDSGGDKQVVPDMSGQASKTPPRFLWFGTLWRSPNDCGRSFLTELQTAMAVHARFLWACRDWTTHAADLARVAAPRHLFETVKSHIFDNLAGYVTGLVATAIGLPPAPTAAALTLTSKPVLGAVTFIVQRRSGPGSVDVELHELTKRLTDETLKSFRELFRAQPDLPVVLWLDDAQWIDGDTLPFLKRLWEQAVRQRWPLFVIATHWEREWREHAATENGDSLSFFRRMDGFNEWHLERAPTDALRACVRQRLPGLTESQTALMIEKADGNFQQLRETIGLMMAEPMNFQNERLDGPLTASAANYLRGLASKREQWVGQRFQAFDAVERKILGWAASLGPRFPASVVAAFARQRLGCADAEKVVDRCIDPYAVLGRTSPLMREFRDDAYRRTAAQYYEAYLSDDADHIADILRSYLHGWVATGVSDQGAVIVPQPDAPAHGLAALSPDDRRDVLELALQHLPLPDAPDWSHDRHRAALRAICLAILDAAGAGQRFRVLERATLLAKVRWSDIPLDALNLEGRDRLFSAAHAVPCRHLCRALADDRLSVIRRLHDEEPSTDRLADLRQALNRLGHTEQAQGLRAEATRRYTESLEIARMLFATSPTAEMRHELVVSLHHMADVAATAGRGDDAWAFYQEAEHTIRGTSADEFTARTWRSLAKNARRRGDLAKKTGRGGLVLDCYREALEIARQLFAEERSRKDLENLIDSLTHAADFEARAGNQSNARRDYQAALVEIDQLCAVYDTPDIKRDRIDRLLKLGDFEKKCGQNLAARAHFEEAMASLRALPAEDEHLWRLEDMARCLKRLGNLAKESGDLALARVHYGDALAIKRSLCDRELHVKGLRELTEWLKIAASIEKALQCHDGAIAFYREVRACQDRLQKDRDNLNDIQDRLWCCNQICGRLSAMERHAESIEVTGDHTEEADRLEEHGGDRNEFLTECTTFWQARERAAAAIGDTGVAATASQRVARLRARVQRPHHRK